MNRFALFLRWAGFVLGPFSVLSAVLPNPMYGETKDRHQTDGQ